MENDTWNKEDIFVLKLYSPCDPLAKDCEGLEAMLDVIESLDDRLRPDVMYLSRRLKYSRQMLRQRLPKARVGPRTAFSLGRSQPPNVEFWINISEVHEELRFFCTLTIRPFAAFREAHASERLARPVVAFVQSFAQRFPIAYGLGHSRTDFYLGSDPHDENPYAPKRVYEAYWLNIYGPHMVEALGRQHVLATPAHHLEELPGGAVLWLSRPTPADFDSEEARLAQARALVHLRPELSFDSTLTTLRQRSLAFSPIPIQFHEDVADIIQDKLEFDGLLLKRQNVEHFNRYQPPPVSEWLPASQAPAPDVDDVARAISTYEDLYAEQLVALLHSKIPALMEGTLQALPKLDYHLWHFGWGGGHLSPEEKETLIPALGAWLGNCLVHSLGGRWLPRRNLDEAAVLLGDRAWLPFLRARHALQGPDAPLHSSCTQFFREAQRLTRR